MDAPRIDARAQGFAAPAANTVAGRRIVLILPLLCALVYPFLLRLMSVCAALLNVAKPLSGPAIAVGVIVAMAFAAGIMRVSFALVSTLGDKAVMSQAQHRARILAHLAFATPSLWVGFGNLAGVMHDRTAAEIAWPIFWALLAMVVLLSSSAPFRARDLSAMSRQRLGTAHGISAVAIVLLLVVPHIGNHLTGIWNGAAHLSTMRAVRLIYRNEIVQPLLLALIGFQILSGLVLARSRLQQQSNFFGTLQTMTGAYVGVYLLAHMTAVFSARYAGTDTNWNWLTYNGRGMLPSLGGVSLIPHYWLGVVAIFTHIGCGLRGILQNTAPGRGIRVGRALFGLGVIASSVILVALLGVHID